MFKKLTNKLKMRNKKPSNPGNVYIPSEFEVEERKKDVDENKKWLTNKNYYKIMDIKNRNNERY